MDSSFAPRKKRRELLCVDREYKRWYVDASRNTGFGVDFVSNYLIFQSETMVSTSPVRSLICVEYTANRDQVWRTAATFTEEPRGVPGPVIANDLLFMC